MVANAVLLDPVHNPESTMYSNAFRLCYLPENAIAGQQGPLAAMSERESKGVGDGQPLLLPAQNGGSGDFCTVERFDDNAKRS